MLLLFCCWGLLFSAFLSAPACLPSLVCRLLCVFLCWIGLGWEFDWIWVWFSFVFIIIIIIIIIIKHSLCPFLQVCSPCGLCPRPGSLGRAPASDLPCTDAEGVQQFMHLTPS